MDRRDFLAAWIQAFLLAVFPFLRERPAAAQRLAGELADRQLFKGGEFKVSVLIKGYEVDQSWSDVLRGDPNFLEAFKKA